MESLLTEFPTNDTPINTLRVEIHSQNYGWSVIQHLLFHWNAINTSNHIDGHILHFGELYSLSRAEIHWFKSESHINLTHVSIYLQINISFKYNPLRKSVFGDCFGDEARSKRIFWHFCLDSRHNLQEYESNTRNMIFSTNTDKKEKETWYLMKMQSRVFFWIKR